MELFDQVCSSKIYIIDKTEALAHEVMAKHVEQAGNNEKLMPEDFRRFGNGPGIVDGTICLCG